MLKKYAAALLPALVILLGALQLAIADGLIDETEGGQLIALVAGLVLTYVLPIVENARWKGALKTGAAIAAAAAALVIPLITGFTLEGLLIFAIAVISALATDIGVELRTDPAGRHAADARAI